MRHPDERPAAHGPAKASTALPVPAIDPSAPRNRDREERDRGEKQPHGDEYPHPGPTAQRECDREDEGKGGSDEGQQPHGDGCCRGDEVAGDLGPARWSRGNRSLGGVRRHAPNVPIWRPVRSDPEVGGPRAALRVRWYWVDGTDLGGVAPGGTMARQSSHHHAPAAGAVGMRHTGQLGATPSERSSLIPEV